MSRLRSGVAFIVAALMVGVALAGCSTSTEQSKDGGSGAGCRLERSASIDLTIHRRIRHDPTSYTQGLVLGPRPGTESSSVGAETEAVIYESSGLYGSSRLSMLDRQSGTVLDSVNLSEDVFAEGIALTGGQEPAHGQELIQLTWKEQRAYRWEVSTFSSASEPTGQFRYDGEGWGLTTLDDGALVMSDGSDQLVLRDPATFKVLERHTISRLGGSADRLNELEWDGRWLWANRYQTNEILRIDTRCWRVTGVVDATALRREAEERAGERPIDVLNGIAYDQSTGRYLVTGKLWPTIFEVSFEAG